LRSHTHKLEEIRPTLLDR